MLRHIGEFLSHFIAGKKYHSFKTNSRISSLLFENDDILKLIRSLNIQKAHGLDDISIRMIKISDLALVKPLSLVF